MKVAVVAVVMFLGPALAWGIDLEFGAPTRALDGARISVGRLVEGKCWAEYYDGELCLKRGVLFAHAVIKGSENVSFLGDNIFIVFRGGPYWSRLGVGLGVFDGQTERVRTSWDFNLSVQYGFMVADALGLTIGWDHWSNGRSFAERLGMGHYWPDHNDGGNTLLFGVVIKW